MSSAAQIDANRANAQLSTGPRTVEGKAASSRNALQLGIHAASLVIPGEDAGALAQLSANFHRDLNPVGEVETELLEVLIRSTWLQGRLATIETQVINSLLASLESTTNTPLGDMFIQDCHGKRILDKIYRRQSALQRDFFRALNQLRVLQASRVAAAMPDGPVPDAPDRVRFVKPAAPPAYTGGPTPVSTSRDNWDNPALRL